MSQHTALTVNSNVPTMTLANYAYGTAFGGEGAGTKSAKIEYTATDDFVITSRQGTADANDTLKISDGKILLNTAFYVTANGATDGAGIKIPNNIGNGNNQQVLTSDGNGNVSWADANASTVSVTDSGDADSTLRLILSDGVGQPELKNDAGLTYNTSTNLLTIAGDLVVDGSDILLGNGANSTLKVEAVDGDDTAGKNLTISAGQGTGTGAGGSIVFQVADGGDSGSSANALATALTIADDKTATFAGNILVNGTTTTVNSTTVTVDDPIFTLGGDTDPASDDNKDRGIEYRYHDGTDAKIGFFGFDDSQELFTFVPDATNTSEVMSGTIGDALFTKMYFGDKGDEHISGNGTTLSITGHTSSLVSTTGALTITGAAASTFSTAAGDLTVSSAAGSLNLTGAEADAAAVKIHASNAAGGIDVDAGTGGIAIDTTGGLSIDSSATGAAANLSHVGAAGQDLTVACTAGSLNLTGGEADAAAVAINASNAAGGIDMNAGTGGIAIDTTGALSIDSSATGASANLSHVGAADNDLTVACTAGSLNLTGGEADAAAIKLNTSNAAGGIDIDAGTGGVDILTTGVLSIDSSATNAAANLSHVGAAGQDLTVACTAGSLNLTGGEADAAAVKINASNAAGGIDMDAGTGGIAIDTTGGLSIDSSATGASANLSHVGAADNDLTVACTAGSLNLTGAEADAAAVKIHATNDAGGIDIDAGTGGVDILTTGVLSIDSSATNAAANLSHVGAAGQDLTVACTAGSLNLTGGEADAAAVAINASNAAGGIDMDAGTGGIAIDTTGALSIDSSATNASVNLSHVGAADNDLTVACTAGSLNLNGGEANAAAVKIEATDTAGGIDIDAGTGGIDILTTGALSIDSSATNAAVNLSHVGAAGQDLTVACTAGSLNLTGAEADAAAVKIESTNAAGGIDIDAGTGGIDILTTGVLSIDSSATAAAANLSHVGAAGQDLTVACTAGSLNLTGGEADAAAIKLNASNAAGGIDMDAGTGGITIDTTGALSIDSSATNAAVNLSHVGAAGQDLTVACTAGSLNLTGAEADAAAVKIEATNAAGGIDIDAGTGGIDISTTGTGAAAVNINASAGGATVTAAANKNITLTTSGTGVVKVATTLEATNVIAISDGTLKTNITPLNDPLATINKLHGVQYDWKDPNNNDHEIGLIAQDVEKVVPEVVRHLGDTNLKGVEYQKLTAILIEAVKELSSKVNKLENN